MVLEASTATERRRAAEALGQLGAAEAIGPLRRALSRRRLFGFRISPVEEAALDALARLPGQDAVSELHTLAERSGPLGVLARAALDRHSGAARRP
jgi:HEAT repeat protein